MALTLNQINMEASDPTGIYNHNHRIQKPGVHLDGVNPALTRLNKNYWDDTKFYELKEKYREQLKLQNQKHIASRKKSRVRTWAQKTEGKSMVSDWEISLNPKDFPEGKIPKEIWLDIRRKLVELCPAQMSRALGYSIHFDEVCYEGGFVHDTRPHMSIPFCNFFEDKKGNIHLDSAYYKTNFKTKSRIRPNEFSKIANQVTEFINEKYNVKIPLNSKKEFMQTHFDPYVFNSALRKPENQILNFDLLVQVHNHRQKVLSGETQAEFMSSKEKVERAVITSQEVHSIFKDRIRSKGKLNWFIEILEKEEREKQVTQEEEEYAR